MHIKYGLENNKRVREAVRGVVLKDDSIGIINVQKYDCYIFPGGGVDEGENHEVALKREMLEEAGLLVNINKHLLTTESFEPDFAHVNHYYECEIIGHGDTAHTDIEKDLNISFEWIPLTELYDYYLLYEEDLRFGDENMIIQKSIKSRGYLLMTLLDRTLKLDLMKRWIGRDVVVTMDRPIGYIKEGFDKPYPINYGFIKDIYSLDAEEVDCYCIDETVPMNEICGKVIAIVKRFDDVEDKLVVSNKKYSKEEIMDIIRFQEQFYDSVIIMED